MGDDYGLIGAIVKINNSQVSMTESKEPRPLPGIGFIPAIVSGLLAKRFSLATNCDFIRASARCSEQRDYEPQALP